MPANKKLKDKRDGDVDYTVDGVPISAGMKVWDYDIRANEVVGPCKYGNPDEPVWYEMVSGGTMDGNRMWVYHPSTGEKAS